MAPGMRAPRFRGFQAEVARMAGCGLRATTSVHTSACFRQRLLPAPAFSASKREKFSHGCRLTRLSKG